MTTEANVAQCLGIRVCRYWQHLVKGPWTGKQHSPGWHRWWNARASAETTMPGGRLWMSNRHGGTQQMPSKWWWIPISGWWMPSGRWMSNKVCHISSSRWCMTSRYHEWWRWWWIHTCSMTAQKSCSSAWCKLSYSQSHEMIPGTSRRS